MLNLTSLACLAVMVSGDYFPCNFHQVVMQVLTPSLPWLCCIIFKQTHSCDFPLLISLESVDLKHFIILVGVFRYSTFSILSSQGLDFSRGLNEKRVQNQGNL